MGRTLAISILVLFCGSLSGCRPVPEPINYGSDPCHFCRMTIVDRQHAAEMVTGKGKVFKFDAVECMVNSMEEIGADNIALYLCNTYDTPAQLLDAGTASFLVSEALQSPMGANLTAFSTVEEATNAQEEYGGTIYTWDTLLTYLKNRQYVYYK